MHWREIMFVNMMMYHFEAAPLCYFFANLFLFVLPCVMLKLPLTIGP